MNKIQLVLLSRVQHAEVSRILGVVLEELVVLGAVKQDRGRGRRGRNVARVELVRVGLGLVQRWVIAI
jgi:hypothetical protein